MRRVLAALIAGLVLTGLIAAPTLAHTATATCDHITLGNVPKGVSATLTPGPIVISPPNASTSINGTYEVPPATYMIVFSDGSIIHRITVPACPSPTPSATPSPTPSGKPSPPPSSRPSPSPSSPAPSPSTSPTASPSPSNGPSASPSPSPSASSSAGSSASLAPSPAASPTGSGGIEGATATPRSTAPETATLGNADQDGLPAGLPILLLLLVGINAALATIVRTERSTRRG
jgi:hypothetical protein